MSWFSKSATAEPEPVETEQDRLARAEAEVIFSSSAYDAAVLALRQHILVNGQNTFGFVGESGIGFIQTLTNDSVRKRLEREVRSTMERRNLALKARADLLAKLGLIHVR